MHAEGGVTRRKCENTQALGYAPAANGWLTVVLRPQKP